MLYLSKQYYFHCFHEFMFLNMLSGHLVCFWSLASLIAVFLCQWDIKLHLFFSLNTKKYIIFYCLILYCFLILAQIYTNIIKCIFYTLSFLLKDNKKLQSTWNFSRRWIKGYKDNQLIQFQRTNNFNFKIFLLSNLLISLSLMLCIGYSFEWHSWINCNLCHFQK